jgi:hypothetical protein
MRYTAPAHPAALTATAVPAAATMVQFTHFSFAVFQTSTGSFEFNPETWNRFPFDL